MDIKNIKEMFKKNKENNNENNNSAAKSNIVINAKDYALENELNKILRNYPILNYINQNLGSIDIKNTLKEAKSIDENVIDDGQNIKNVKMLKTFLFKK